jgi:hypothetical protein
MWNSQPQSDFSDENAGHWSEPDPYDPGQQVPLKPFFFFFKISEQPISDSPGGNYSTPLSPQAGLLQMLYLLEYLRQGDTSYLMENTGAYLRKPVPNRLGDTLNTKLGLYSLNLGNFGAYGNGGIDPDGGGTKCDKDGGMGNEDGNTGGEKELTPLEKANKEVLGAINDALSAVGNSAGAVEAYLAAQAPTAIKYMDLYAKEARVLTSDLIGISKSAGTMTMGASVFIDVGAGFLGYQSTGKTVSNVAAGVGAWRIG